jgi:hypothetical protein
MCGPNQGQRARSTRVRAQYFFGWDKGLQAAGLDPNDITLPSRGQVEQATRSTG